ncbi:MAG: right-handed parallel beta-helix repeat-containing protein [Candidatus Thorarchaeota archaeon]|jgi:parallel beta-helix repeat protein
MKKYQGLVLAISILFCLLLVPQSMQHANDGISNSRQFVTSDTTPHDEIVITHNDNFTTQGWEGNGTLEDPYLISDIEIRSSGTCINISNTDSYFIIENCHLISDSEDPSGYAISLESVQNGEIRNIIVVRKTVGITAFALSETTFSNVTIYDSGLGMFLEESNNCYISNSTITRNPESPAITLYNSDHCDITNNRLIGNRIGFLSNSSDWITVTNNTIVGNSEFGITTTSGTKKLAAYWNNIGWNGQNAADNGSTKFWDNGNQGNWWSDYDNESDYFIPGSANAKDRFPQVWVDNVGPDISTQVSTSESEGEYSLHVSAEIIDDAAVNQSILSVSVDGGSVWTNVTMDWAYASWITSVENLSADTTVHYVVYASDFAGNWEVTSIDTYYIPVETDTTTTATETSTTTATNTPTGTDTATTNTTIGDGAASDPLILAAIAGAVIIICVLAIMFYYYPSKFTRSN